MKRLHSIIVVLLTVAMLFGVAALSAYATDSTVAKIGDVGYDSLTEAFSAAQEVTVGADPAPVTIKLTKNVTLGDSQELSVELDKLALTLDLGGYTLDVSSVVAEREDTYGEEIVTANAAISVRGVKSSLTVKNGTVLNTRDTSAVFAIPDGADASLVLEDVFVNANGGNKTPLVYAGGGKTVVNGSELVAYGYGSYVIYQAGNAEVVVNDSDLLSVDGASQNSAIIKTATTATSRLTDGAVERPHIYIKDSSMFASSCVIAAHIGDEARPGSCKNSWVVFEGCDIEQCNRLEYNDKLLESSNNRVLNGKYIDLDFDGCSVEYARVAFDVQFNANITVKDSVFSMTHGGQTHYLADGVKTECPSYFVIGKANLSVSNSSVYLANYSNGAQAEIADPDAWINAQASSDGGFKLLSGTATNATGDISAYVPITLTRFELTSAGYYIGTEKYEADIWSDNWYSAGKYEAKLNGEKYKKFSDAYKAAKSGDRIQLLSNVSGMQTIEKSVSIMNFVGYEINHTSSTHKAVSARGYVEFVPAKSFELVKVKLVTDEGVEQMTVAAGNYAVYTGSLKAGWCFSDYKLINFKGWGDTPDEANLGASLPFIDGSNSTVTLYAVFDVDYNLDSDYAITDLDGSNVQWGGKYDELTELNEIYKYDGKVIVLLKNITTNKTIKVNREGNIYIDLNGHTIVTDNNYLYSSERETYVYQYDGKKEEGKTPVRKYTKGRKVYELKDGEWVLSSEPTTKFYANTSSDDPVMTDYAISLGDFEVPSNINGSAATLYLFSSAPGAAVDTGTSPMLNVVSNMRIYMKNSAGAKISGAQAETTANRVRIGNSALPAALSRMGDNRIMIKCSTFGSFSQIYNHETVIDDAHIIASDENGVIYGTGGLQGKTYIYNSVLESTCPGASIIRFGSVREVDVVNTTFLAVPKGNKYPDALGSLLFHNDIFSALKKEITDCHFINCTISTASRTAKVSGTNEAKIFVKNAAYNLPGAATGGKIPLQIDASYTVDESAIWNTPVSVGDKTYILEYKLFAGEAPEKVTVSWIDSDGNPIRVGTGEYDGEDEIMADFTQTYFKGAKVICPKLISADLLLVSQKPVAQKNGAFVADDNIDLDSIQSDATVMVSVESLDVKYNVNISSELTLSIYVPVPQSGAIDVTKISLMTPDEENLISGIVTKDGVDYYRASSCAIAPNKIHTELTYAITVVKTDGDGTVYTGVKYVSVSILDYASEALGREDSSEELIALVNAMLVYANEAYKYFDGTENAEVKALIYSSEVAAPTEQSQKSVADISAYVSSVSLSLKSRAAFVFEVAAGVEALVIDNVEYKADGGFVVYSRDIADMNDAVTIEVGGAHGVYDLAAYIEAVKPASSEKTAYALTCALNLFAEAADAYFLAQ